MTKWKLLVSIIRKLHSMKARAGQDWLSRWLSRKISSMACSVVDSKYCPFYFWMISVYEQKAIVEHLLWHNERAGISGHEDSTLDRLHGHLCTVDINTPKQKKSSCSLNNRWSCIYRSFQDTATHQETSLFIASRLRERNCVFKQNS